MNNTYLTLKYNSKSRWLSYWYQVAETLEVLPNNVLVIGKGSGITEGSIRQLSNKKTSVLTLDINNAVAADVVGEVTNLPFENDAFDVALCCQVLEHIPFDSFPLVLSELHRVSKRRVVLSLPHGRKHLKIVWSIPFLEEKSLIVKNPFKKNNCKSGQHFWEIGRSVSRKQVIRNIARLFDIEKEFLNEISCDHRFFILKRKKLI
jgi:ubiquinone/menaquinone biosynthesis C-methylase UbiE